MKKLLTTFILMSGFAAGVYAQAPQAFNYQGVVRNAEGEPLENQPFSIRFSILQGSATGTVIYQENQQEFTNGLGLFTLKVGEGVPVSGVFSDIDWASSSHYLKVELNAGGSGFTDLGATQLLSVPYALYAASSGGGSGPWQASGNNISNTNAGGVGIGTSSIPAESKLVVGAMNSTSEGGQIQLNAPGGTYNTAYYLDNYEDRFRIMHGTNSGSTSPRLQIDPVGNVAITGGELHRTSTGAANMVPIAYGTVNIAGTVVSASSSNNVSSTWNATNNRYEITITGENFDLATGYVATATPQQIPYMIGSLTAFRPTFANVRSASNKLYVIVYNAEDMTPSQAGFSFVVYKP